MRYNLEVNHLRKNAKSSERTNCGFVGFPARNPDLHAAHVIDNAFVVLFTSLLLEPTAHAARPLAYNSMLFATTPIPYTVVFPWLKLPVWNKSPTTTTTTHDTNVVKGFKCAAEAPFVYLTQTSNFLGSTCRFLTMISFAVWKYGTAHIDVLNRKIWITNPRPRIGRQAHYH